MKLTSGIALCALASIFTLGHASAQDRGLQADIPFEFTVGGRLLPAGTYTLTMPSSGIVLIQSADKRVSVMNTTSHENQESKKGNILVFDKYGNQYFLHEVLSPTMAEMNLHIPMSKLEKQVQRQEASLGGAEPVLIAAR